MRGYLKILVLVVFPVGLFGAAGWSAEVQREAWSGPVMEQVRMPAGVRDGVFYPAHDELVVVRPGAWSVFNKEDPAKDQMASSPDPEGAGSVVALAGRMKLFDALKLIADAAGRVFVPGPGVEDSDVVVELKDRSVVDALRHVLYPAGYGFRFTASDIVILARDTRMFHLNLPPVTQAFNIATTNESLSASSKGGEGHDGRMRVGAKVLVENSSGMMSYWQDMETNVRGLLSPAGILSVNKAAGVIAVTDTPRDLDRIDAFLKEINVRSSQQIVVDVKVVEVELSKEYKLGIDWGALLARGDLKGLKLATNFAAENMSSGPMVTFSGQNKEGAGDTESGVRAVVKALEAFGRIEVVSQPRVMMLNNSVASIQVGETRSYVESTDVETTQNGSTITSATLNEVHGGVTLQIVGSITGEDIFLNVTPVVSMIDDIRTIPLGGGSKLEAPDTSVKTMSTLVRVKDGHTVAIGGLITHDRAKQRSGIPFLCRLPVIGKAFSYELSRHRRTELVIFMTPRRG